LAALNHFTTPFSLTAGISYSIPGVAGTFISAVLALRVNCMDRTAFATGKTFVIVARGVLIRKRKTQLNLMKSV
jgi:hypothetical protein